MNRNRMRGRIVSEFGTQKAFAEALGVTAPYVSSVVANKKPLGRRAIKKWATLLQIAPEQYGHYFFED